MQNTSKTFINVEIYERKEYLLMEMKFWISGKIYQKKEKNKYSLNEKLF